MVSKETCSEIFENLKLNANNNFCIDCKKPNPLWVSVSHGCFICFQCANLHRQLGVHISYVKSIDLDQWTVRQLQLMVAGGNTQLDEFLNQYPFETFSMEQKYKSKAAQFYRDRLKSSAHGYPHDQEPPSLEQGIQEIEVLVIRQSIFNSDIVEEQKKGRMSVWEKAVFESRKIGNQMMGTLNLLGEKAKLKEIEGKTVEIFQNMNRKIEKFAVQAKHKTSTWVQIPEIQSLKGKTAKFFSFMSKKQKKEMQDSDQIEEEKTDFEQFL